MSYKEVKLTSSEMLIAAQSGVIRQVENISKKRKAAHGAGSKNDWQLHIEGCLGEMALSKYLDVYYSGKGKFRAPDVGVVDVRTSTSHNNRLILHKEDPDERVFYFVTGVNGEYRIQGWILGKDGKQDKFWTDPRTGRPAYFIPVSELNEP